MLLQVTPCKTMLGQVMHGYASLGQVMTS